MDSLAPGARLALAVVLQQGAHLGYMGNSEGQNRYGVRAFIQGTALVEELRHPGLPHLFGVCLGK